MEGTERRLKLIKLLQESSEALSGNALAKHLGVSRQIIVQDIALLRAGGYQVISTPKGYLLSNDRSTSVTRTFYVKHTNEQIEDELCTIVDHGGKVLDVEVTHPIYGTISTELILSNRSQVYEFVANVNNKKTTPLKELTNGEHSHTVEAISEDILDEIESALRQKKYLIQ